MLESSRSPSPVLAGVLSDSRSMTSSMIGSTSYILPSMLYIYAQDTHTTKKSPSSSGIKSTCHQQQLYIYPAAGVARDQQRPTTTFGTAYRVSRNTHNACEALQQYVPCINNAREHENSILVCTYIWYGYSSTAACTSIYSVSYSTNKHTRPHLFVCEVATAGHLNTMQLLVSIFPFLVLYIHGDLFIFVRLCTPTVNEHRSRYYTRHNNFVYFYLHPNRRTNHKQTRAPNTQPTDRE